MRNIAYSKSAAKALARIPANEVRPIRDRIEQHAADPASQANNLKRLHGRPGFRLRVGDWRVIFDERGHVLDILEVGPRGGIYD